MWYIIIKFFKNIIDYKGFIIYIKFFYLIIIKYLNFNYFFIFYKNIKYYLNKYKLA